MTEAEWQKQLLDLAHLLGWRHMHARRSRGKGGKWTTALSVTGFPDLTLWSERRGRLIFVELKSQDGKTTPEQDEVLASLAHVAPVFVWRPDDLDVAQRVLSGVDLPGESG